MGTGLCPDSPHTPLLPSQLCPGVWTCPRDIQPRQAALARGRPTPHTPLCTQSSQEGTGLPCGIREVPALGWSPLSLCYLWAPAGKGPKASALGADPSSAAFDEVSSSGPSPAASASGDGGATEQVHPSSVLSWRSGCLATQVPSSVGLCCQGSEVTSWGPLRRASSFHQAPQGYLWAAPAHPPTLCHVSAA